MILINTICTSITNPWGNPMSSMDKRFWIEDHFGSMFHKKMFVTHRKDLLIITL